MSKRKSAFTVTHYAAASFTAALFAMVGVLAVVGGTASGETAESDAKPAEELAELDTTTDEVTAKPDHQRSPQRRPGGRQGPPSFDDFDEDSDGNITRAEFDAFRENHMPPAMRGQQQARGDFDDMDFSRGDRFDGPPRQRRGGFGGPRGLRDFDRGEFQRGGERGHRGPPLHMRGGGQGEHRQGPPPHMRGRGQGEHRQGPPPQMRGRGKGEHRQGPPPHMRGRGRGEHHQGSPPRMRDGEGPRGPRPGGSGEFGQRPPRPDFDHLDSDGDGSVSEQEFEDFRPPRGPRGDREFPREESF